MVCNIPYGGVGARTVDNFGSSGGASCSTKHVVLKSIFESMGLPVKSYMGKCTLDSTGLIEWTGEPAIDYHNYLKVCLNGKWQIVDATFGINEGGAGFSNNLDWSGQGDCQILFPTMNEIEVNDIFLAKQKAIGDLAPHEKLLREQYFQQLSLFISSSVAA